MDKPLHFLLADDDPDDLEMFGAALQQVDPSTVLTTFSNGLKLTQYLEGLAVIDLPCAVILDYNMPHKNGPAVLDWMCERPGFTGIHKFIWSTAAMPHYMDDCMNKGAVKYFIKPVSESGLLSIAEEIVAFCKTKSMPSFWGKTLRFPKTAVIFWSAYAFCINIKRLHGAKKTAETNMDSSFRPHSRRRAAAT